jgi:AraC-like DNA-binding protein
VATKKLDPPVGVLGPPIEGGKVQHERYLPSEDLAFFVEHYGTVIWDFRGHPPYIAETLPHPSVHLVLERGKSKVRGIEKGKFSRRLAGAGRVFSAKFRPGGFFPFFQAPVARLTDREVDIREIFGRAGQKLEREVLALPGPDEMVPVMEAFLRGRNPPRDENVALTARIVERIISDRDITKVEHVAAAFGLTTRTLQRLFSRYVGVSPKWVIGRHRLHEAADAIGAGADVTRLAFELGYFDQAHFIKDFKTVVGVTPAEYAKRVQGA